VCSAQQGPEILASVDRFFEELLSGREPSAEVSPALSFSDELLPACGD
jgi:hypothetical protein